MKILNTLLIITLITAIQTLDCGQGSIPSSSGICISPNYIQGCSSYSSINTCQQCEYNYVQNGNTCIYSPPTDYSGCCQTYNTVTGVCNLCANGLSLINGKCQDIKIIGCLLKDPTGTCLNCASLYTLFGGQCIKNILGCLQYTSTNICSICDQKYTLLNGYCIPNSVSSGSNCLLPWVKDPSGNCTISGCRSYFEFGCAQCQDGFRLLPDGSCLSGIIIGCDKYTANGSCLSCLKPLFTQSSGFCLGDGCLKLDTSGRCILCDINKGYNLIADGSCLISNCLVSNSGQCLLCSQGYIQTSTGCSLQQPTKYCTTCGQGYFTTDTGDCSPKQQGCLTYSGSRCSSCDIQYYLSTNYQCILKQPGCIYNNGLCSDCSPPFKINSTNGRCMIQGCAQYSTTGCQLCSAPYILDSSGRCTYQNCLSVLNGICQYCADGYAVGKDGFCFQTVPYCKTYNSDYQCIQCNIGYYLDLSTSNPTCTYGKFGCNYVDGICVSCRAPFTYIPTTYSCQIDGCLTYFLGGCSQCAAGYSLQYNSCKLPNCLISFQGHCKQCDPDYVMTDAGNCVNKDQFCWTYDSNGVCIECAPNYYMSTLQNKCLPRQPGCLYNSTDQCYKCDLPFYFDGVRCQIYGCMKLSNTGCSICNYPMQVVNSTGLCLVVNCDRMDKATCVVCKPGYVLATDGSCQYQDPKCLVTSVTGCITCIKGYVIDSHGACQYVDQHCVNFSIQGNCTNCDRLYFLNIYNKCQVKDSNCLAYSGGRCIQCKSYFYIYQGLCLPNSQGCLSQINPKTCSQCEVNYIMTSGICTPTITKLDWNSIVMDFSTPNTSQQIFTVGKTNKYNLDGAISKGLGQVFYSSCISGRISFQVDDNSQPDGWAPSSTSANQYVGVLLQQVQIFYAIDIKYLQGCTMTQFSIQRSDDGKTFVKVSDQNVTHGIIGTVQTFYFTPVQALAIRIVILVGIPNIKFQFYYSNGENIYATDNTTYIQQQITSTILDSLRGQLFQTSTSCVDKQLCWMGIQLCDATPILGFTLVPNNSSNGSINTVTVKYSVDGVQFNCYNSCNQLTLVNGSYNIQPPVTATKLRVYPGQYTGSPSYSITFKY